VVQKELINPYHIWVVMEEWMDRRWEKKPTDNEEAESGEQKPEV
jgi:hypothetical protein